MRVDSIQTTYKSGEENVSRWPNRPASNTVEELDGSQSSRGGSPNLLDSTNLSPNPKKSKNLLWASTMSFFASILLALGIHTKEEVCGIHTNFLRLPSALATITLGAVTFAEWLRTSPQGKNLNLNTSQNNKFEEVTFAPN